MSKFTQIRVTEKVNNKLLIARVQLDLKTKDNVIDYAIKHLEDEGIINTGL